MSNPQLFSSAPQGNFLRAIGESFKLSPLELDPPEHGKFRALLNPLFSPQRVIALEPKIRAWSRELIEAFAARGHCNLLADFAEQFPTGVFIDLMGLPRERLAEFRQWNETFIHGATAQVRIGGLKTILGYFQELFAQRRQQPTDDMVCHLMAQQIDGRTITDGELLGLCFLLFSAGLDTIVNSLAFIFRYLAERPDLQQYLRKSPAEIPRHAEEMMRLVSPVTPQRVATQDTELAGVMIKAGDYLTLSLAAASRDPAKFPQPQVLDAQRNPNPHFAFGHGIHRCIGAQLARRDIAIAIEEWLARIPPFEIDPAVTVQAMGGSVLSLTSLHLRWPCQR
jgi:cytochrome P450